MKSGCRKPRGVIFGMGWGLSVSIRTDAIRMEIICMYILIQMDRKKKNTKNKNFKVIAWNNLSYFKYRLMSVICPP